MGIITTTEKESVERCGWMHDFNSQNRLNLESANPLRSLFLGTLWHKTLDALAQRQTLLKDYGDHKFEPGGSGKSGEHCAKCSFGVFAHTQHPDRAVSGFHSEKIREHYKVVTGRAPMQLEMAETYKTIETVGEMLKGYLKYYNGLLLPEGWEYIRTEQQFLKVIPGTEHCECYLQKLCTCGYRKNGIRKSCRYLNGYYVKCRCTNCTCRQMHMLEGTLDGLIRHVSDKKAVLENKTFSVHPHISELHRTSQFQGYDWISEELDTDEVLYNGIWTRTKVPDGYNQQAHRKWNIHDLYLREAISWSQTEKQHWVEQLAVTALRLFDPHYIPVRTVPAVGGCNGVNGCSYKTLCDARFHAKKDYTTILESEYRQRERTYEDVIQPAVAVAV